MVQLIKIVLCVNKIIFYIIQHVSVNALKIIIINKLIKGREFAKDAIIGVCHVILFKTFKNYNSLKQNHYYEILIL